MDFMKSFDPASIKLHSMSLMCPWQFKSWHSREMEGHVPLLNTFFLVFRLKLPTFLQLCNLFFSLALFFPTVHGLLKIILLGWNCSYLKEVEMTYFENRRFDEVKCKGNKCFLQYKASLLKWVRMLLQIMEVAFTECSKWEVFHCFEMAKLKQSESVLHGTQLLFFMFSTVEWQLSS